MEIQKKYVKPISIEGTKKYWIKWKIAYAK